MHSAVPLFCSLADSTAAPRCAQVSVEFETHIAGKPLVIGGTYREDKRCWSTSRRLPLPTVSRWRQARESASCLSVALSSVIACTSLIAQWTRALFKATSTRAELELHDPGFHGFQVHFQKTGSGVVTTVLARKIPCLNAVL